VCLKSPERDATLSPREREELAPFVASATSMQLGWVGLEAVRYRDLPETEIEAPPSTHHALILLDRPPGEYELRFGDVDRHVPPPAGTISIIPAGSKAYWRWSGPKDSLHVFLEPRLVARVAESFDLDPSRVVVPAIDRLDLPQLRSAMQAVDAEMTAGGIGGGLVADSLANVLAVHLIRHLSGSRPTERGRDGALPRGRLRSVVEYVEDHLDAGPTLEEMAAVARLSPYHFARQFKAATGLPPHQFVIARRVERARLLLQEGSDLPLAQIATRAGFSDQSQLSHHFKRIVGVTPGRFRPPARTT